MIDYAVQQKKPNLMINLSDKAGAIAPCRYIYLKFTGMPKYNDVDLKRYHVLVGNYCQAFNKGAPDEWELKDGCPTHAHSISGLLDKFDCEITRVGIACLPICQSVRGMITIIMELMASLEKRTVGKPRKGSVEGLFFSELACWLFQVLPQKDFKSEETLKELLRVKEFCESVKTQVLIPENKIIGIAPPKRNTPTAALEEIIQNLDGVIDATHDLVQSRTFNAHIEQLDNSVVNMAAQTFHIMNLLIKGNHDHEATVPVALLLDEKQQYRPKIREFKEQRLAGWLIQTLVALGITRNDFKNTRTITLADTERHLIGECINDDECTLPKQLRNSKHKNWGHWPFSIDGQSKETVATRLEAIREIYKNTLKIYHLRTMLSNVRKGAPTFGEIWLYGDPTGRAMVKILMLVADELTTSLHHSLYHFWNAYLDIFNVKKSTAGIQASNHDYIATVTAIEQMNFFDSAYQSAKVKIADVENQCKNLASRLAQTEETKLKLLQHLVQYLEFHNKTDTDGYLELKSALEELTKRTPPTSIAEPVRLASAVSSSTSTPAITSKTTQALTTPTQGGAPAVEVSNSDRILAKINERFLESRSCLDLSSCKLSELPPDEIDQLFRRVRNISNSITSIDLSNNGFEKTTEQSQNSNLAFRRALHLIPGSIITLDLRENSFEHLNREELNKLFAPLPRTIQQVFLSGKEAKPIAVWLERVTWPQRYQDMTAAARAKGNIVKVAEILLNDYTKGNSWFMLILSLHWNRHYLTTVSKLVAKIKDPKNTAYKNIDTILTDLKAIDTKNYCGSLARRKTFIEQMNAARYYSNSGTRTTLASSKEREIEMTTFQKQ